MIRQSLVLAFILFLCSQDIKGENTPSSPIQLIYSAEVIKEGIALHNEQKYALAIEKFLSVPESDTNFFMMSAELINSYIQNKEYDKAVELGEVSIKAPSAYKAYFYSALGNAYDENGEADKAIATYEAGLKLYPYDHLLNFNLGVTLLREEEIDKAKEQFIKAITINPYHANSHLFLGNIMISHGKKTRAMMCLGTYLSIVPNNNNALVLLNDLLKNSLAIENILPEEEEIPSFYETDLLIRSNAALDKKFKSAISFRAPVAQQTELLLESLQADEKSDDFWMKFYVPLFTRINENNLKETFIYHMLASANDKSVDKWLKKNKKELSRFYDQVNLDFKTFRATKTATLDGISDTYTFWYYDNHKLNAIGNQVDDNTFYGPWVFYHVNGEKMAEGKFLENGEKIGHWRYYHKDGSIKKTETYDENGKVNSTITNHFEHGKIMNEIPYKEDKMDGLVKLYYPCGQLKEEIPYKEGKVHGAGTVYYKSGAIQSQYNYEEGELTGPFTYLYENGNKKEVYTYADGVLEGAYEFYHQNGARAQQGQYKGKEMNGDWTGYYEDGTVKLKGKALKGNRTGLWLSYNQDGSLLSEENYDQEGNFDGTSKYYTEEGKLHFEYQYENGSLTGYKYYNENKEIVSEASNAKGNFTMTAYYADGKLLHEGPYVKGQMNGEFTFYYHNGLPRSIVNFKADEYHGKYQYFYESGQKKIISEYKNGVEDGFYQQFYKNGALEVAGWLVDGTLEQTWVNYYPNGKISHKQYYLSGETHGSYEEFDKQGRPMANSRYYKGLLTHKMQFDTLGAVIRADSLDMGTGKFIISFDNQKPRYEIEKLCGENSSDAKSYHKNGHVNSITSFKHGAYNGTFKAFYPNNTPKVTGQYLDDERSGIWTWYFESGKIDSEIPFKEGKIDGQRTDYYEHGQISSIGNFVMGERRGSSLFYAHDGTLQIEKQYDQYGLVSYRYLRLNDEMSPYITLEDHGGTVKAYYPSGQISVEQNYKKGLMDGSQIKYHPNGNIQQKRFIQRGEEEGTREDYYPNGQIKKKSPYKDGLLDGLVIEYYESGSVKSKTAYLLDEKEGWEEHYDENGKSISKTYYRDDYVY